MKKILLFVLLLAVGIGASARKSYITLYSASIAGGCTSAMYISGDVPGSIEGFTYVEYYQYWENKTKSYSIGEVLNLLSEYGYEVEFVNSTSGSSVSYLLSKETPSNQTHIEGDVNKDNEVTVADVNAVVDIILGLAKSNPSIMKQLKEQLQ